MKKSFFNVTVFQSMVKDTDDTQTVYLEDEQPERRTMIQKRILVAG